jgi:hypothetical protein
MPASPEITWVSLREASERAGVSVSWLRKQYREHGLATCDTVGPRGLQKSVPLEEVVARAAVFVAAKAGSPAPNATAAATAGTGDSATESALHAPLTLADVLATVEAITRARQDTNLLDRIIEVEVRAARAEAEAAYLMLRLEDAYTEIDDLRQRLTASQ